MGKAAWAVLAGLPDVPRTCTNLHELRDVSSSCSLAWESPPGYSDHLQWDQEKQWFQGAGLHPLWCQRRCSEPLGVWEPGRGEAMGWGLEWMEPGRLDGRQQWLVCRNQMRRSCWWTCELLDAPNPTRSSLPGWSTISYPRPRLDRCYKHVCLCSFSHYPIRVPLLQLPRSPGKLRDRKKELNQTWKAPAYNAGDLGLIPGSGRSLEKEMATHSSTLAWKISWTEEPGGLEFMGSQRIWHDEQPHFTSYWTNLID